MKKIGIKITALAICLLFALSIPMGVVNAPTTTITGESSQILPMHTHLLCVLPQARSLMRTVRLVLTRL